MERMGDEKLAEQMPKNWSLWREKGFEEDRECDSRTALREIWKEWEENAEQLTAKDRRRCHVGDCC